MRHAKGDGSVLGGEIRRPAEAQFPCNSMYLLGKRHKFKESRFRCRRRFAVLIIRRSQVQVLVCPPTSSGGDEWVYSELGWNAVSG
jgi:hypothetical protein